SGSDPYLPPFATTDCSLHSISSWSRTQKGARCHLLECRKISRSAIPIPCGSITSQYLHMARDERSRHHFSRENAALFYKLSISRTPLGSCFQRGATFHSSPAFPA